MSKITVNQHTPFNNIEVTKLNPATASPVPSSNVTLNVTLGSASVAEAALASALSAQSAASSASYYAQLAANSANSTYTNSIAFSSNATNITSGILDVQRLANSGAVPGTYGSASQIPVITVDSKGRITVVNSAAVAGVTSFTYTPANSTLVLTTGDGSNFNATLDSINSTALASGLNTAYSNAVSYVSGLSLVNTSQLSSNLSNYALLSGATFTGNIVANNANTLLDLNVGRNLFVTGNLTIGSNVNVIGANNLSIIDNMIYLNSNSTWANPDIGFAANYNDGTYHHAGFFRDHVTGTWKVFDNYLPEPDDSIYINQSDASFHIANFQANQVFVGNNSVYSTINTTSFTGTANSANFIGTLDAANVVSNSQLSANLSNYQTTAGLAANVANLASNSSAFLIQPIRVVNANSSIVAADGLILANSTVTLTLPAANSVNGASYEIKNINTGTVTIVGSGADTIDGYANMIISFKNSMLGVQSIGSGWIVF